MADVLEFRRKVRAQAPAGMRYVLVCVDGDDGSLSHSEDLDGYQVLGILEWGKMLKLAECEEERACLKD